MQRSSRTRKLRGLATPRRARHPTRTQRSPQPSIMEDPMPLAVRLGPSHFHDICAHLLRLGPQDRYLRFGHTIDDHGLVRYAHGLDPAQAALFGVVDPELELVAFAHLALDDDCAELGLSVLPGQRRRGMGQALLERAVTHARARGMRTLFMQCLADNAVMQRLARRTGMAVVTHQGETEARLALQEGTADTQVDDWMNDQIALIDYALRARWLSARRALESIGAG
jgi:GNAT superfamily N-acetyltransferase